MPPRHVIRICGECNSHLGRHLEQAASSVLPSIMFDGVRVASASQLQLMTTWATKCMLLATLNGWREGDWGRTECVRAMQQLMERSAPPDDISVRIGILEHPSRRRGISQLIPTARMPKFEFYSISRDGDLVWEVLHLPNGQMARFQDWTDQTPSALHRIWPSPGSDVDLSQSRISLIQIQQMRDYYLRSRNHSVPLPKPVHRLV